MQNQPLNLMHEKATVADGALFVDQREINGVLSVNFEVVMKKSTPQSVQNFLAAVHEERMLLADLANGKLTDADRYRALRDFAMLGSTDKARFERINDSLHQFEDEHGVDLNDTREFDEFDQYANLLALLLAETDPNQPAEPVEMAEPAAGSHPQLIIIQ